jgi:hypothetical protein
MLVAFYALLALVFGSVFALMAGAESDQFIGVAVGGLLLVFLPVGLLVLVRLPTTSGGHWASSEFAIEVRPSADLFLRRAEEFLGDRLKSARPSADGFRLRTGMSGASFGESISIGLHGGTEDLRVSIRSRSRIPFNVLNGDINAENVQSTARLLRACAERG